MVDRVFNAADLVGFRLTGSQVRGWEGRGESYEADDEKGQHCEVVSG